jgi:plasmid stabilization system protein ParE
MTRPPIRFHSAARRELHAIGDEYDAVSAWLGDDFSNRVDAALQTILDFPEAGSPSPDGNRRLVLSRFPYSIIYRVMDTGIVIVAIAHHRQEPGYWTNRRT